jgi:cobalt/nickel transport protein
MRLVTHWAAVGGLLLLGPALALAHYHLLLPQSASGARDRPMAVQYLWGHPFEHELFDAAAPEAAVVLAPDGQRTDLTKALNKISVAKGGKKAVTAYRLDFTPPGRGDYTLLVTAPPVWMEAEQEFWQDTVRVVVHVATQKGWDAVTGRGFELVPLTRPYGLQPGMVFQAQALMEGKALPGAVVEVEHYNPAPPRELPPDEQITRRVKTDPNGVATCTLTEAGWWCVTAQRQAGRRERQGKMYPVRQRATFWVHVDEASLPQATK